MRSKKSAYLRLLSALILSALLFGLSLPARAQANVTLLVHGISVQAIAGTSTYDVSVVFSLLDSAGNPIKDAALEDFTLSEDDQPVQALSLDEADEPINVAIVLDTSGSMVGEKMTAARAAASRFIDDLQSSDQVAVLTFDTTVVHRIDFTTDHLAAKQQVELIEYTPGGATCLYDAAYETIQMTAALPTGRRAVILLTDGVDEAGGQPCSLYTLDDVIALASDEEARVPLYTIGLGEGVDANSLDRMARQTGGRYQASPGTTQLDALFGRLADELRSQYVLHYTSAANAGEHTLIIHVNYNGAEDEVSRTVEMPALPYSISFTSPVEGATVGDATTIMVSISGQGAPIQKVVFFANTALIGSDESAPYELEWDLTGLDEGQIFLEALAQDGNGAELARSGITITYQPGLEPSQVAGQGGEGGVTPLSQTTMIIIGVSLAALVVVVVVVIVISAKKRKEEKERDRRWKETVQGEGVSGPAVGMEDRTMDSFTPSENALGMLVILESDDPALRGQRFEISKSVTTLGRKSTNDVMFPKDGAVSRQHAVIEERGGSLYLSEVMAADDDGKPKRPTYGTFVNDLQIEAPVALRNGDQIRLGKRVRIRFEGIGESSSDTDQTMDQFSDSDKTMDG
jgi:Ca-activated chloride channel family protein